MQVERYVWARFFWQQARNKRGVPRRHVCDTARNNNRRPETGTAFTALCSTTVTPHPDDGDTVKGTCFAPACQVCTILLARAMNWNDGELGQLVQTFHWTHADIALLATALDITRSEARRLLTAWTDAAK
jgi:hypothetical protein